MPYPLFDFAYVSALESRLQSLAELAEPEEWTGPSAEGRRWSVLHSYLHHTFARLQDQGKIAYTASGTKACFNTGLVTPNQEFIYAYFVPFTPGDGADPTVTVPWYLKAFLKESDRLLADMDRLPDMATYFDDPKEVIYDVRCELRINFDHIIDENRERFPEPFRSMTDNYQLRIAFQGARDHALKRVARNYKTAIPQFHQGRLQLLLPISMNNPATADMALAVERHGDVYRAATCLTLDMAYNNARLLARPDQEWLRQ